MKSRLFLLLGSLPAKVAVGALLVSLVPLGIASLFAVHTSEQVIESIVTNQLENVASEKQALVERWIAERKADVEVIAGSSIANSLDPGQLAPYLKLVGEQYAAYRRFVVVGADGRTVYDTAGPPGYDCRGEAWFQRAAAGRRFMSEVYLASGTSDSVFLLAAPIRAGGAPPRGVLCATVNTEAIIGRVLRVTLGDTGECYLVDRKGTFLVHKDPQRILKDNIAASESFTNIFEKDRSRRSYTDYRQIAVLGASRAIPGTEWFLVVEQDEDEAFASAQRLLAQMAAVTVLAVAGAIGLSVLLACYVTAPVRALGRAAAALAEGDFDRATRQLPSPRRDEIGTLRDAFSDMASHLQQRQLHLEDRVGSTEKKLEQADTRLRDTLEAAARSERLATMGRLASGVAHEVRTPLTSLKLYLQSIQEEFATSPEHAEDFDVAMQQIERLEKTVNHFLQFARPREPARTAVDLRKLVADAIFMVRPRAGQQGVTVDLDLAEHLPPVVGDAGQLGEALVNLLVNALEEMPGGGRVRVSARAEALPNEQARVSIEVSDSGPGIGEADLDRIFEPFFTTKACGSGLGLSIVRATVQRHGGDVRVRTRPGEGTTFSILLPAA